MNSLIESMIKDIAINTLVQSSVGDKLYQAEKIADQFYAHYATIMENQDEVGLKGIKVVTILTFSILGKIGSGKKPSQFDRNDWKDIANNVADNGILSSDQSYSVYIFSLYEKYIRYSIGMIKTLVLPETVNVVNVLADELQDKAKDLKLGRITEVKYREDCLWISLEAMIKLLASTAMLTRNKNKGEYAQAVASFAFEYGRLMLYSRELEIVEGFIASQQEMDEMLRVRYDAYLESLQKESSEFYTLLDNAFSPDYRSAFLQSILLAKVIGVKEEEILTTNENIDDFFLA